MLGCTVNFLSKSCKVCITVPNKVFISFISALKPFLVLWAEYSFFEVEELSCALSCSTGLLDIVLLSLRNSFICLWSEPILF